MSIEQNLLETLIKANENSLKYSLHLNEKVYPLTSVKITNTPTPVNEPTTRGGVYFSDKFAYKMQGIVEDLSIIPLLTKNMLGPNTEFGDLKITTTVQSSKEVVNLEIFANLTNSVQTPNSIELHMILVNLEKV